MKRRVAFSLLALVLAADYFAFQVEIFDDEYEANHPRTTDASSITAPAVTWESFDRENAPQAFTVDPCIEIRALVRIPAVPEPPLPAHIVGPPARDKSPPV